MKQLLFLLAFFLAALQSWSQPYSLSDVVDSSVKEELIAKKEISHLYYNKSDYKLTLRPKSEFAQKTKDSWKSDEKPVFVIEKLYLINKQDYLSKTSLVDSERLNIDLISKSLRSFSTMKGIKYYSNTRKREETLYVDAYTFEKSKKDKSVPDKNSGDANGMVLYCMNNDHSLGKCFYKVSFLQSDNELNAIFDNVESVKYGPMTAVKPDNLQITIDVVDCGEDMLVYMFFEAKFPNISVFANKLTKSFTARVDAMYLWLEAQIIKNLSIS